MTTRLPFLDHPGPLAFAHRGGTDGHVENTMAAFERAISLGYRYLETDVHRTADGALAAFHDPDLSRIAGVDRMIGQLTRQELASVRIHREGRAYRIPLLDEVLASWPSARVNIDPKADTSVEPLIAVLRANRAIDRVCIGSFSDRRIARCREALGPGLCTSMGPRTTARFRASLGAVGADSPRFGPLARVTSFADACLQVPATWRGRTLVDARFVERAHAAGKQVHVWTVNDMEEAARLLDLGVDGIMTDHTADLRALLQARSEWV